MFCTRPYFPEASGVVVGMVVLFYIVDIPCSFSFNSASPAGERSPCTEMDMKDCWFMILPHDRALRRTHPVMAHKRERAPGKQIKKHDSSKRPQRALLKTHLTELTGKTSFSSAHLAESTSLKSLGYAHLIELP